jgi:hypothetical protein
VIDFTLLRIETILLLTSRFHPLVAERFLSLVVNRFYPLVAGVDKTDSITEKMCQQAKSVFGDYDDFSENGGLKVICL